MSRYAVIRYLTTNLVNQSNKKMWWIVAAYFAVKETLLADSVNFDSSFGTMRWIDRVTSGIVNQIETQVTWTDCHMPWRAPNEAGEFTGQMFDKKGNHSSDLEAWVKNRTKAAPKAKTESFCHRFSTPTMFVTADGPVYVMNLMAGCGNRTYRMTDGLLEEMSPKDDDIVIAFTPFDLTRLCTIDGYRIIAL